VTAEPSSNPAAPGRRRTWIVLVVVAALIVIGVFVVRARRQAAAAADCEKEPPKVEFAVAECDAGAPPGGSSTHPAPSATPSPRP